MSRSAEAGRYRISAKEGQLPNGLPDLVVINLQLDRFSSTR